MDLYLPDEFYALSETPNARARASEPIGDDSFWLGGEALIAPHESAPCRAEPDCEPDPVWHAI